MNTKNLPKLLGLFLFILGLLGRGFSSYENLTNFYYENNVHTNTTVDTMDFGEAIYSISVENQDQPTLLSQILESFKLDASQYSGPQKAMYYILHILNYVLSLVSFVLLILVIYAFYLYLVSGDEKALSKVKSILKTVAIVIVLLGLSWMIVSLMFNIYEKQLLTDPQLAYLFL